MATFISLLEFTSQGIRHIQDSPHRADMFGHTAEKVGVKVVAQYWTLGAHDAVLIMEAPDDETAAALLLALAGSGNVRTHTLRAFDWAEAQDLIEEEVGLAQDTSE